MDPCKSDGAVEMKPGSWLELSNYNHDKAHQIFSLGNIDCFILRETSNKQAPSFPFIILIDNLDEINISQWKKDSLFKGFLLRTSADLPKLIIQTTYPLWVDYLVTDIKKSIPSIHDQGFFLSFPEHMSTRKINKFMTKENIQVLPKPYDLYDPQFTNWEDLENFENARIELNPLQEPELSIIIPHYENPYFLCAVIKHLQDSFSQSPVPFEVLVIDDSSSEKTIQHISYFSRRHLSTLPFRFFSWKEKTTLKSGEKIFRAGASRNWGANMAKASTLFFLDSDMLTPIDIAKQVLNSLKDSDVVQFVRKHIPHSLSSEVCAYQELLSSSQLYFEESKYWKTLFECSKWEDLPDYWKYTCTYALGIRKEKFLSMGRFRRNFIRYGLEDTDLGYRLFQSGAKFTLNKTTLLHLTAQPDVSQSFAFKIKKMNRIAPTAKTFYKLHLDSQIYSKFRSLLD